MNRIHWKLSLTTVLAVTLICVAAPILAFDGNSAPDTPTDPPSDGSTLTSSALALTTTDGTVSTADPTVSTDAATLGAKLPTYYQAVLARDGAARASLDAGAPGGLPSQLYVVPAKGGVEYRTDGAGGWTVSVTVGERPHEAVDVVYDLVLAVPLPADARSKAWRIPVRQGTPSRSVPVIYAGEKIGLKRNSGLETTWLPELVASGALPDLSGSGYTWTFWDTIVRYDASAGATIQGFGSLDYSTATGVAAPDPDDARNAAYVITWVPTLDAAVPPYTLRVDVVAPE